MDYIVGLCQVSQNEPLNPVQNSMAQSVYKLLTSCPLDQEKILILGAQYVAT